MAETPQRRATDNDLDASFRLCPRYDKHELTDEQIDLIATNAAKKAVDMATDDFYKTVGRSFTQKIFWIAGVFAVGVVTWMAQKGWIK